MDLGDLAKIANTINNTSKERQDNNMADSMNNAGNNNNKKRKKAPFKQQLKNTMYLLKNTFKMLGRNPDIIKPTLSSIYYSVILRILFFTMMGFFFINALVGMLLLLVWIIALIYKFFFLAKQKSSQSYLVYNTIAGKNISHEDSLKYVKNDFNKYKSIAFIDMARGYIEKANNGDKSGIKGMIVGLILSGLEEVLDLVSNYLLPAMVIENKSINQVKNDLESIKENIPQALIGVFGIDFIGSAVNKLLGLMYFFMIAVSGGIGWGMGFVSETMVIQVADQSVSLLPGAISIVIISLISVVILRMVDGVKVAYFTIFYTNIMKPDSITEDLKKELQGYLTFQDVTQQEK